MDKGISDTEKVIVGILIVLMVIFFFIGRMSKTDPDPIPAVDVSHFYKTIDSLKDIGRRRDDTIRAERAKFDSLASARVKNGKTVKKHLDEIQKFTPTSRDRWRDSVKRTNGL